ncbi:MAG: AAA family ATPase [Planctomycetota bacterium]
MRLVRARVTNYRSIIDSGLVELETDKTILVGPNEAGKTVFLQAIQQLERPAGVKGFDALRDYPRSKYNEITTGQIDPADVVVVEGHFRPEPEDLVDFPKEFKDCTYVLKRKLNNRGVHHLDGVPERPTYKSVRNDLARLCAHVDPRVPDPPPPPQGQPPKKSPPKPSERLATLTSGWKDWHYVTGDKAKSLASWLDDVLVYVDEDEEKEVKRHAKLVDVCTDIYSDVLDHLGSRVPVFVLFSDYFRIRPLIHLDHMAKRVEQNLLDDDQYDYGNQCLLKLLGFNARELSDLGKAIDPAENNAESMKKYRDQLDKRSYQLNAASVKLTTEVNAVWLPEKNRPAADRLRVSADGQYLKVVVEDDLGVEIELDQRSQGFQWLVSFFVVFFAESSDQHKNAILLLDEPGVHLHGLKQRDFRETISKLAVKNQTIFTTHSPFLVGPNELDKVRVVEMTKRETGTVVHTTVSASDPAALLPLQEALGYDLAQSLFSTQRNLVLEGLTDHWYLDATAQLLNDAGVCALNEKIALGSV